MLTMEEYTAKAARALDRIDPTWFTRVNTSAIEMASCSRCVLGWAFGGWREGLMRLGFAYDELDFDIQEVGRQYGFAFSSPDYVPAWIAEINARRGTTLRSERDMARTALAEALDAVAGQVNEHELTPGV